MIVPLRIEVMVMKKIMVMMMAVIAIMTVTDKLKAITKNSCIDVWYLMNLASISKEETASAIASHIQSQMAKCGPCANNHHENNRKKHKIGSD